MIRDNQPWHPVTPAQLTWQDDGSPYASDFDDVYFSREDGLAESRYVFLEGNDLPQRWGQFTGPCFGIAETGFGTGLNFLLTWQAWRRQPQPRPDLHYLAVELHPLTRQDLARCLALWPELGELGEELASAWPGLAPGEHRLLFDGGRVRLDLWWADASTALADLARRGPCIDAWYLDGFAPARNAGMWQPALFESMAALSRECASFSTFTAAGDVRRGLQAAGFRVEKAAGFGRKRDSLRGDYPANQPRPALPPPRHSPWDLLRPKRPQSIVVLGAGLAGCHVAAALARRGLEVTLLERGEPAAEGSANRQGILYTRLSRKHSPLADFAQQSFLFAAHLYRQMFDCGALQTGRDGELCGSFHLGINERDKAYLATALATVPELGQVLDSAAAGGHLGLEPGGDGLWFPASGWLHPAAVCRALLQTPGIQLQANCGPLSLHHNGEQWQALAADTVLARADTAVIATGCSASETPGLEWLPLQAIRGQTTHIPTTPALATLRAALCHEGYIAPGADSQHCIGATFNLRDDDCELRPQDHQHNLDTLLRALPQLRDDIQAIDATSLPGRVGFRCASPDYLPMAGAVPDYPAFLHTYAPLRKNARQFIPHQAPYMPQLYLSTAHGSRGLSSTPLCAEWLASLICAEPAPISSELQRALAPARFPIRDLARNKV